MPNLAQHDPFFAEVFSQRPHFAAFAQAALAQFSHLLCWDLAQPGPTASTDQSLLRSTADLLWRVPLRPHLVSSPSSQDHVTFLLEHKSHPDPQTLFQVYLRLVRLWNQPPLRLPKELVVPVVVTNTPRPWDVQASAERAFRAQGPLRALVPRLEVVQVVLDEELEERVQGDWDLKAAVRALWVVGRGEVGPEIRRALEYAAQGSWASGQTRFVEALLRYVTSGKMGMSMEELGAMVGEVLAERGVRLMSTYQEHWRQLGEEEGFRRGMTEGLERGRREGLERGRREGLRDSVHRVVAGRFGQVPKEVEEGLVGEEDLERLEEILVAASTSSSLQEFLDQVGWNGSSDE